MKALSFFAGIGGFDLGFERAGIQTLGVVEIDANCRKLLAAKFPRAAQFTDIREVRAQDLPQGAKIFCGGSPCQDFSLAGLRAGLKGARSGLFKIYANLIASYGPAIVVWENVRDVLNSNGGKDFARIISKMAECGYYGAWRVLDSQHFGIPQQRRRVFAVFTRTDLRPESGAEILALASGLQGHPEKSGETPQSTGTGTESSAGSGIVGTVYAGNKFCGYDSQSAGQGHLIPVVAGTLCGDGGRTTNIEGRGALIPCLAKTITSSRCNVAYDESKENYIGGSTGVRRLTPLEWERLQGFPDGWTEGFSDTARYKMIGNAVTVPVAQWIAQRIMRCDLERRAV